MKDWFKKIESAESGTSFPIEDVLQELTFDDQGLIPVIAQDSETAEILMFAWMNRQSLGETISSGRMCYWSRSRQAYWKKGESSGHIQQLKELTTDCDGDVLLAKIEQTGGACHTNRRSCFYIKLGEKEATIIG
jgi:phosphoribosyl-AMP cyclohydrolase